LIQCRDRPELYGESRRFDTILVQMLLEPYAKRRSRQYPFKRGLAQGKRIAPQIVAVEFDQIERPHENVCIMPAVPDAIEVGYER
jgi:hypothetical protein